jgi:hypothetical protein
MTATTTADTTSAVTHTCISHLALHASDGQVLVQVTTVPLAITMCILSRNSIALLGIIASMEARYLKKTRLRLDPWGEH